MLLSRFTLAFLGRVFVEELAAGRDGRFVAGRRLDALLPDEAVGKALHRVRWWVRWGAVAGCGTEQWRPAGGCAGRKMAGEAS